ncbi:MAG TPA: FAD-linked oxidase C-terminal domain-containing protein [Acidobacteriota bacterium]|nr:FAD-linked oxidase C-terminal domain-containing protein [Acidobacteriota bacterium]
MDPKVMTLLRAAVGPGRLSDAPEDLTAYAYDGTWAEVRPAVVVHPENTRQVAELLRAADAHRIPVVPRGAGTGLAGGAVPVEGSICLNLARMNSIIDISTADTLAVVQPGVVTFDLQREVQKQGLFYPPDPASVYQCSIGGNVATNAGGPRCLKYGVTADYVLGLEVVLAGGRVMRLGGRAIKDVAGYNLKQLFIGSEGTLGVVTEITLRLIPKPAAQRTALAAFPRLADACRAVGNILQAGVVPLVTELMDQGTTRAVEEFKHLGLPTDVDALLLVAVDGDEDLVKREIELVAGILGKSGARDVRHARSQEESEELWEARRSISPAIARLARNKLGEDITVPRSRIPEMVARLRDIARENNLPMVVYGHIGDGNLHPTILCDRRDAAVMKRVEKAAAEVLTASLALGGTLTGEHGIGIFKLQHMPEGVDPIALDCMQRIKNLLDPHGIMNPGKKLPAVNGL